MPNLSTLRRHRIAALLGVALVASPLAVLPAFHSGQALAASDTAPTGMPSMGQLHPSFAPIVNQIRPAVVTVTTKMRTNASDNGNMPGFGNSPFDQFFRQFFGQNGVPFPPQQQSPHGRFEEALGSGFIIDSSGVIVTNNHVIKDAEEVTVTLDDGTKLPAKVVGHDAKTDLAVLRVKTDKPLPTVAWGDSGKIQVGDAILAVGNPFGLGITVTSGIVSARGRDLQDSPYNFIQIDASINHGNSGGPLVDMDGQVVGINTAIYTPNGGSVGVGFAIPSDQAKSVVAQLLKNGKIEHGYIGVEIQRVTPDVANAIGLDKAGGALVARVNDGTPAASAGVKQGDVITGFNGQDVTAPHDLARMVSDTNPGTKAPLKIWRQGKSVDLTITVGNAQNEQQASNDNQPSNDNSGSQKGVDVPSLGIGLADLTPDMRNQLNLGKDVNGALIENVDPDKPAANNGLQQGDVILSVNQAPVSSAQDAKKAIMDAAQNGRKSVLLLIDRGGSQNFVALPLNNA
jgi:serine protease Do